MSQIRVGPTIAMLPLALLGLSFMAWAAEPDEWHGEREVIQLAAASRSWVVILASFLGTDPLKYGEHMGQYSYIRIVHLF